MDKRKKHPSKGAYNRGCRCQECKNIVNNYQKQKRLKINPNIKTELN
jgi:hypothetical protein